ncbi:PucR family transcriptional regulator [Rhodococcoides fascians]|uniref:Carbohydrate diacid regulator n=1 Tax=Rhodococcoides fascians TaxID=1828 RepID=A0A143QNL6_RHOFA|nr:helix-turn-helix domain-containing protein [Rhodococcus fascians]AMY24358.1 Carbohydrate diacid regulator [Rhodococcus fascians]KMJ48201.1 CdaR family transcriptional regulator [Rhodococcus fascians]MBY4110497.1 helix-turn-helix domain-containing protein [Rhodococcus fascians]MBY4115363.1 helix-turn-helix domain-containing protein [Rhodococcus fascians]OZC44318.1 CdaR family transcriptional regulator [Rhodococcus fascians]
MATQPDATPLDAVAAQAASDAGGLDVAFLGNFLDVVTDAVDAGVPLTRKQLRECRVHGDEAARAGVALRALLDLYLSAAWRLWRELPVVQAAAADPAGVVTAGEVMLRAVDDAAAELAEGFQLARRTLVRVEVLARREFVDDLLSGTADVAGVLGRAQTFGLDLSSPHAVAVVTSTTPFTDATSAIGLVERSVQGSKGDADLLVATKQGRLIVVFPAPDREAVDHVLTRVGRVLGASAAAPSDTVDLHRRGEYGRIQLGVGRPRIGAVGVAASYRDALDALDLASSLGLDTPVVDARDLLVYRVLISDRAAIADLVETLLTPLTSARGGAGPLLETLQVYFETGANSASTARRMHLSVRAVTYRLSRIRDLTGQDVGNPVEAFALHTAVLGAMLLDWPRSGLHS